MGIEQHSDGGGALGLDQFPRHAGKRHGHADARRDAQLALRDVEQAGRAGAAAGEDAAGAQRLEHAALAKVVAQHVKELAGARLENLAEQALADDARLETGHAGDLDLGDLRDSGDDGVAVVALDLLSFGRRHVQADSEVVGEVIAANGD